jgi:hypothetical protein
MIVDPKIVSQQINIIINLLEINLKPMKTIIIEKIILKE